MKALIVEHERATPGGLVYDWLDDYDAEVEELRIDVEEREVDPAGYDLIVPLGSEFAAYDDTVPWIQREIALLERAAAADAEHRGELALRRERLARSDEAERDVPADLLGDVLVRAQLLDRVEAHPRPATRRLSGDAHARRPPSLATRSR